MRLEVGRWRGRAPPLLRRHQQAGFVVVLVEQQRGSGPLEIPGGQLEAAGFPVGDVELEPRPDFVLSSQNGRQNCTALGCSSVQTSRQRFLGGGPE